MRAREGEFSVSINDDNIIENVETFQVRLTAVTNDTISANIANVTIIDNDGAYDCLIIFLS